MVNGFNEKVDFIWSIADLLRGDYKQSEYQKVILPLTVLRRLDCVTEPNKDEVLQKHEELQEQGIENVEPTLKKVSGHPVYNTSEYTFESLCAEPENLEENLKYYIQSFNPNAVEIIEKFEFDHQIERLADSNLLYQVVRRFSEVDLHPDKVANEEMGYIYEELIRKFSELSNETAGEHFTPREVIRLMVNLLFEEDDDVLTQPGVVRTLYDPACGTGGMLSVAEDHLRELNEDARLVSFGQELNPESYAVCNSDMLLKGQDPNNIVHGNSFTEDGFSGKRFDYMLSNPPFGVSWKKVKDYIETEHEEQGADGRFGEGTPSVDDGQFLFLQHMISKMKSREDGGSRIAIVFNGSPLFSGGPNSGESAIRRWIIENDWLEAVVGLPENLFYNTEIQTYIWILSNNKPDRREDKVQLIDAREMYEEMDESLGEKRHRLTEGHIRKITQMFGEQTSNKKSKIVDNSEFGYRRIVIDRPLRLTFRPTKERIDSLEDERAFTNRDEEMQTNIKQVLSDFDSNKVWKDGEAFLEEVKKRLSEAGIDPRNSVYNAIERALGKRDPEAEVRREKNGDPKHDIDLRNYERIGINTDPEKYFSNHITQYLSNAWINDSRRYHDSHDGRLGEVGYEINFEQFFYEYTPPRNSEEIEQDIQTAEEKLQESIEKVIMDD